MSMLSTSAFGDGSSEVSDAGFSTAEALEK